MYKRLQLTLFTVFFILFSIQTDRIVRRTTAFAQSKVVPAPEDILGVAAKQPTGKQRICVFRIPGNA